jgi:hypothetical protein
MYQGATFQVTIRAEQDVFDAAGLPWPHGVPIGPASRGPIDLRTLTKGPQASHFRLPTSHLLYHHREDCAKRAFCT